MAYCTYREGNHQTIFKEGDESALIQYFIPTAVTKEQFEQRSKTRFIERKKNLLLEWKTRVIIFTELKVPRLFSSGVCKTKYQYSEKMNASALKINKIFSTLYYSINDFQFNMEIPDSLEFIPSIFLK
jgi:hypothetical protein